MHRDKLPIAEAKARRAANIKRYYAANRDDCLARTRAWQKLNTARVNARRRHIRPANAKKDNASNLAWRLRNPEKVKAAKLVYRATPEGRARDLVTSARRRAKKTGSGCSLSLHKISAALTAGVCQATGIRFVIEPGKGRSPFAPSLDRIDCSKGYTDENTRVVVWALNMACGDYGEEVLWQIVKARWPERLK